MGHAGWMAFRAQRPPRMFHFKLPRHCSAHLHFSSPFVIHTIYYIRATRILEHSAPGLNRCAACRKPLWHDRRRCSQAETHRWYEGGPREGQPGEGAGTSGRVDRMTGPKAPLTLRPPLVLTAFCAADGCRSCSRS